MNEKVENFLIWTAITLGIASFIGTMPLAVIMKTREENQHQEKIWKANEKAALSEIEAARKLNAFNSIDSNTVESTCQDSYKFLRIARAVTWDFNGRTEVSDLALGRAKSAHKKAYQEANTSFLIQMRRHSVQKPHSEPVLRVRFKPGLI